MAEDNQSIVYVYHILLEGCGYEVIDAYNGEEAVEQYKKQKPDLVLMDIRMPVKNGDEAIKDILEHDPGANIIAVTAYDYSEEQLGVPVLRKGFRKEELLAVVEAHIR